MKVIVYGREDHVNQEIMSAQIDMLKAYCRTQRHVVVTEFGEIKNLVFT